MAVSTVGRPGVFVSESLTPLVTTPAVPGQAIAAFVGKFDAGPVGPTLISSWAEWKTYFGGFGDGTSYLPHAVHQYLINGGGSAYVVRAVAADAVVASVTLNDVQTTPSSVLTIKALAPGATGNRLLISITAAGTDTGRFNVYIREGSSTSVPVEQYVDVSLNPSDARNLIAMVGAASERGSQYISATYTGTGAWTVKHRPAEQTATPLAGGLNGTATPDLVAATKLLDAVEPLLTVNLPGVTDPLVINPVIAWAEASGNRFVVVDSPRAAATYASTVTDFKNVSPLGTSSGTPYTLSSYAAVYGPWLHCQDPSSQAVGATRVLPPGGAMLGLFAQADAGAGTQQSPAGADFPLRGAVAPEVRFQNADLDTLNELGINIIRSVPGSEGLIPMGSRTLKAGRPDRYVAIRRTLMYVTRLVTEATNFAVFRPNSEDLWGQITSLLQDQLSALQQARVLRGATAAEAFYVVCDATNNTPNSVANGAVNIEIGLSLTTPAEFVVIKIGQMASGATAEDSLAS
ncbi:phage tail sheath subtilisin-like domain-containing protein [Streptomyces sp. NPDC017448]|uniref:phage tail sheath subtilisin-like domain-containing protein n=1 Tax=Streptomyces sp. NPDC017448 TaxID=3364996 RepID=UPI0037966BC8